MNIAMLGSQPFDFHRVFSDELLDRLRKYGTVSDLIDKKDFDTNKDFLSECEIAFSTWGMLKLSENEIKTYLPNLKVLFYAAGSVQDFAEPFLRCGVRVVSAASANAIPVAEFVFSQISLATKGYFMASRLYKPFIANAYGYVAKSKGNYNAKIGLVGLGAIGSMVAQKLKNLDVEVLAYDPFVSEDKANELNVKLVSLEELFRECDVISNHLANKKELINIFDKKLFSLMKNHTVFINTGRGAQVNEKDLAKFLWRHPSSYALIDVLKNESKPFLSPLFWCRNAYITPHMAGSSGNETQRMALFMICEAERYLENKDFLYEVKASDLKLLA